MITILLHKLRGGGVQRSLLHLAQEFHRRGQAVEVVACRDAGPAQHEIPSGILTRHLRGSSTFSGRRAALKAAPADRDVLMRPVLFPVKASWHVSYLPGLTEYLKERRPSVIFAAGPYMNLIALWARELSGAATRVVASERVGFPHFLEPDRRHKWRWRYLAPLLARSYQRADAVVAVSEGVADELAAHTGLERERISVIYNPVVTPAVYERAKEAVNHPWLPAVDVPVILAVGRFSDMKDFPTLIRAFARLRAGRPARLVILGEGKRRGVLERLIKDLGIAGDVDLPGWSENPYPDMANASLFVLSSRAEGLPNALLEAMAVGCPVVSTDCPSGPREILDGGRYGPLVEVGDDAALARAMARVLDSPPDRQALMDRAAMFSQERSADAHLALFERILNGRGAPVAAE